MNKNNRVILSGMKCHNIRLLGYDVKVYKNSCVVKAKKKKQPTGPECQNIAKYLFAEGFYKEEQEISVTVESY
jgi:hypothetical protein